MNINYWKPRAANRDFVPRIATPSTLEYLYNSGKEALYHSPFSGTYRMTELYLEEADWANQGSRKLSSDEANEEFGIEGQLTFNNPIYANAAQIMRDRKQAEIDRGYMMSTGSTSWLRIAGGLGVGFAATALDPINFASMFIPIVGGAKISGQMSAAWGGAMRARLAQGLIQENKFNKFLTRVPGFSGGGAKSQRVAKGFIEGAVGAGVVEPFVLFPAYMEASNYNWKDTALNMGMGAALGSTLHLTFGAVSDRFAKAGKKTHDLASRTMMKQFLNDETMTSADKVLSVDQNVVASEFDLNSNTPQGRKLIGEIEAKRIEGIKVDESKKLQEENEARKKSLNTKSFPDRHSTITPDELTASSAVSDQDLVLEHPLNMKPEQIMDKEISLLDTLNQELEAEFKEGVDDFDEDIVNQIESDIARLDVKDFRLQDAQRAGRTINQLLVGEDKIFPLSKKGLDRQGLKKEIKQKFKQLKEKREVFTTQEQMELDKVGTDFEARERGILAGLNCMKTKLPLNV